MRTYIDIKTEILYELALIKDAVNIEEYLDEKYFRREFIEECKGVLHGKEPCKCNLPYVSKQKFEGIILDILLQNKHREDVGMAIQSIFNMEFGTVKNFLEPPTDPTIINI